MIPPSACLAAGVAGCVVMAVVFAISKLGGALGGALGAMPHAAVLGTIQFSFRFGTSSEFYNACLAMPIGNFCNAIYMAVLISTAHCLPPSWSAPARLVSALASGVAAYVPSSSFLVLWATAAMDDKGRSPWILAGLCCFCHGVLGMVLLALSSPPQPSPKGAVSLVRVILQGALASTAFLIAMAAAEIWPSAGGVLVNLPLVSTFAFAAVWLNMGEAQAREALPALAAGMFSANLYSIVATLAIPAVGAFGGAALAFCLCVSMVTAPIAVGLERRKQRAAAAVSSSGIDQETSSFPAVVESWDMGICGAPLNTSSDSSSEEGVFSDTA